MEYNGFTMSDFDFFKKRDKMEKNDYEKGRNDLKMHFRGFCYEMQKEYHKKTGGVFEISHDYQSFTKKSTSICALKELKDNMFDLYMELNSENIIIEISFSPTSVQSGKEFVEILKSKKDVFKEYVMKSNNIALAYKYVGKDKKVDSYKIKSIDMNSRNYETLVTKLEEMVSKGKLPFRFSAGSIYTKKECTAQKKEFIHTAYESAMNLIQLAQELD